MRGSSRRFGRIGLRAGALSILAGAGYLAMHWRRRGQRHAALAPDLLLDRFMPEYDVREQHDVHVLAPAEVTYGTALTLNIYNSAVIRAVFRARERMLRAGHRKAPPIETPFVEHMISRGWAVLAEEQRREIVLGAITKAWEPNPQFEPIPAASFASFSHPKSVKIAWSVSVEALPDGESIFRTETRVQPTDAEARRRFRRYWVVVLPGVRLIRREALRLVKAAAEDAWLVARRAGAGRMPGSAPR